MTTPKANVARIKVEARANALAENGKTAIATAQTVHGTAWQKTAHRIVEQVAAGNRDIVVVTNGSNPHLDNIREVVNNMNLAMVKANITLDVV